MAKSREEMEKIMSDLKKEFDSINASAEQKIEIAEKRLKQLKDEAEAYKKIMGGWSQNQIQDMEFEIELQEMKRQLLEQEMTIRDKIKSMMDEAVLSGQENTEHMKELERYSKMTKHEWMQLKLAIGGSNDELRKLINQMKELDEDIGKGEEKFEKMVDHTNKADRMMDSWGKKSVIFSVNIGRVSRKMEEMFDPENIDKYSKAFIEQINPFNLFPSIGMLIIETSIKMALAVDSAAAAFNGATGAAGRFNEHISEGRAELNAFGVTADDVANATKELLLSTSNYTSLNERLQKQLTNTASLLSKVSVSTKTSADMFNVLTEAIHVSDEQASSMMTNLLMMGTDIGISAEQMGSDWLAAMGTLAVYGPRSEDIFTNLAAAAKAAGVSTEDLLKVAGKFDTFQDSAKTVAGLNALLGTNLSTTQMLMMTEDERVEHLIKTMQAQGRSFKDLDRWQKKAVANQLGFKDVAEAEMVLSMDVTQYEQYQEQMKAAADAQKKLEEAAVKSMPIATKLLHLFNEAAIDLFPLFEWMGEKIEWLTETWKGFSEGTKKSIKLFFLIGGALLMLSAILAPVVASFATLVGFLGTGGGIAAGIAALVAGVPLVGWLGDKLMGSSDVAKTTSGPDSVFAAGPALETNAASKVNNSRTAMSRDKTAMNSPVVNVQAVAELPKSMTLDVDGTPLYGRVKEISSNQAAGRMGKTMGAGYSPS